MNTAGSEAGVTLVELVLAILILAVALAGVLSVFDLTTRHSADPMVREQARAVAEAYLEEVVLQPFADPSPGGDESGEARGSFDDVDDYDGLEDVGVRDQTGTPVPGLGDYRVTVAVLPEALDDVPAQHARRITVTVTPLDSPRLAVTMSAFRTDYY
jgi:MSHA pilin protein MshD